MSTKYKFECDKCGSRNTTPVRSGIHYCLDCEDYFEEDDHEKFTRKRRWQYDYDDE